MQEDARKGGSQLETAHRAGNDQWQSDAGRADWLEPDLDVAAVVPLLRSRGARSVLDLGCGVGRHACFLAGAGFERSEEHTSELQSLMRISYAVFCLKKKINKTINYQYKTYNGHQYNANEKKHQK